MAHVPPFVTPGGGGEPPGEDSPFVKITPVVPAIAAQPTPYGRTVTLSGVTPEGVLMLGYGDSNANTHPIDVIGFDPVSGEVETYLQNTNTEELRTFRVFADGSVWVTSEDPAGESPGFIATNRGGLWHTIPVDIPSLTVPVHLHDVAETLDGTLWVAGSRDILPSESAVRPGDEGAAIVWKSTNGGTTWTEALVYFGAFNSETNRFWAFGKIGNRLVVSTQPATDLPLGYYVLSVDGVWSAFIPGVAFPQIALHAVLWGSNFCVGSIPPARFTLSGDVLNSELVGGSRALAVRGTRIVTATGTEVSDNEGRSALGSLFTGTGQPSGAITPDGTVYVCNGADIYRVDFPAEG